MPLTSWKHFRILPLLISVLQAVDGQSSDTNISQQANEDQQQLLLQSCQCHDVPPSPDFQCPQQVAWSKCMKQWMIAEGFCYQSCGFCKCHQNCTCFDIPPDENFTCQQQHAFGKCNEQWMLDGDYCSYTCGRCNCLHNQQQQQQQQLQKQQLDYEIDDFSIIAENFDESDGISVPELEDEEEDEQEIDNLSGNGEWSQFQQQEILTEQEAGGIGESAQIALAPIALPMLDDQLPLQKMIQQIQQKKVARSCSSLSDEVGSLGGLGMAAGFLNAADIDRELNISSPCTLLLPSDEAFNIFLSELGLSVAELIVATSALKAYLHYHIIPTAIYSLQNLAQTPQISTMLPESQPLQIHTQNDRDLESVEVISPAVNATIIDSDISLSCNSQCVIHKIDHVLSPIPFQPESLQQQQRQDLPYPYAQQSQGQGQGDPSQQEKEHSLVYLSYGQGQENEQKQDKKQGYSVEQQGYIRQGIEQSYLVVNQDPQFTESKEEKLTFDSEGLPCEELQEGRLEFLRDLGGELTGMVNLLVSSTFVEFVEHVKGDLTILAPTNTAFQSLANILGFRGIQELMLLDYQILRELVATHLVASKVVVNSTSSEGQFMSSAGARLSLLHLEPYSSSSEDMQIEAQGSIAHIITHNFGTSCNTWVHVIDNVLIPYTNSIQGLKDRVRQSRSNFATASVGLQNPTMISYPPIESPTAVLVPLNPFVPDDSAQDQNIQIAIDNNDSSAIQKWSELYLKLTDFFQEPAAEESRSSTASNNCLTLMDVLNERDDLQHMVHAFRDAGMSPLIDDESGPKITIFAVQNDFFSKMIGSMENDVINVLSQSPSMQQALMGYMVVLGIYTIDDLTRYPSLSLDTLTHNATSGKALDLIVQTIGQEQTVILTGGESHAVIIENDLQACNGIVHVISHGLLSVQGVQVENSEARLPEAFSNVQRATQHVSGSCCSVVELLENTSVASWFAVLLRETGLGSSLKGLSQELNQPLVLFVPQNEAFGTLDAEVGLSIAVLIQNIELAKELLRYHFSRTSTDTDYEVFSKSRDTSIAMITQLQERNITLQVAVEEDRKETDEVLTTAIQKVWQDLQYVMNHNPEYDFGDPKPYTASALEVVDGRGSRSKLLVSNLRTCEAIVHIVDRVLLPAF